MTEKHHKRPRDFSQAAKLLVDIATGQVADRELTLEEQGKDPGAVALGRRGGLKGDVFRLAKMTKEQRSEAPGKMAGLTRWLWEIGDIVTCLRRGKPQS